MAYAGRIDIETGDMRALPFPDASFDVVVSSLAIHNIRSHEARARAVAEAWRVLKPGGRLAIADIRATGRYATTLRTLGASDVTRRGLGWRFWYGNPFAATSLVTATKPAARDQGAPPVTPVLAQRTPSTQRSQSKFFGFLRPLAASALSARSA